MAHEVYICYADEDKPTADAICHVLEENKFKCWIKPRDIGLDHIVEEITRAIKSTQIMVLVFSENAKESNYVNTEVDMAFSSNIPIVVFKIDRSNLEGGLEFFLKNKHWLDAYPHPNEEFGNLVVDVSKLLNKPVLNPVINPNVVNSINNFTFEEPRNEDKKKFNPLHFFSLMCLGPVVLISVSVIIDPNMVGDLGILLFTLGFLLFIGTPLVYGLKALYDKFS